MPNSPTQQYAELFTALHRIASLTEKELQEFYTQKVQAVQNIDPHILNAMQIIQTFVLRRGKCVRPFLCWCAYMLSGGSEEVKLIKVGTAIEMNHYNILNMDDRLDQDIIRHGGPTVEVAFQNILTNMPNQIRGHYARSLSELASSLLQSHTYEMIRNSDFAPEKILEVMHYFEKEMLQDPATGWLIHLFQNQEELKAADEKRFLKGLTYVTAQYTFVGPLLTGTILADGSKDVRKALTEYGTNVGTAFQIHDDVLGLFGKPDETGKSDGNDVREGKKTLLLLQAYKRASSEEKKFLESVVGTNVSDQELQQVRDIVTKSGSLEYSTEMAKTYVTKGVAALNSIETSSNRIYILLLTQLAEYVITRNK